MSSCTNRIAVFKKNFSLIYNPPRDKIRFQNSSNYCNEKWITGGVLCKKVFLKISQNPRKNTRTRVSFLIELHTSNFTKSNTPLWVFLKFLKLRKWYQIEQSITDYAMWCKSPLATEFRADCFSFEVSCQHKVSVSVLKPGWWRINFQN